MTFELKTISRGKFVAFIFIGLVISVLGGISLGMFFDNGIIGAVLPVLFSVAAFLFAHKIASTTSTILIGENSIQVNNETILFENISGYFVNENVTMTAIDLKLKSNAIVNITGITLGKQGKVFKEFISELKNSIKTKFESVEELSYLDIYPEQAMPVKPFLFFITAFNVFAIYLLLTQHHFTWKIFLFNILALGMIPYLKKKK